MEATSISHYQSVFVLPEKAVPFFEKALDPYASALLGSLIEKGPDKGMWKIEAIFENVPQNGELQTMVAIAAMSAGIAEPKWDLLPVPKKNWLKENLISFPPRILGKFYLYGSYVKPEIPADKLPIKIDAATAFGTGEHATTQGCLQAFEKVVQDAQPKTILDMGCGSGILTMAAVKLLGKKVSVDAVDIDPESVRVTKENIEQNSLSKQNIKVFQSAGFEKVTSTYDLIFANILARPLMEMAGDIYAHLNKGGVAILSGFLTHQKSWVLKAQIEAGLVFGDYFHINEWGTLIVKRT